MKSTLEKRILIFVFLILGLTIGINTALNIEGFRRDYRDGLLLRCQSVATELKASVEKVLALGLPLDELEGINARCQEIVGSDPEINYCLIENSVGQPLYSSDPSFHFFTGVQFLKAISDSTSLLMTPRWGQIYDLSLPIFDASGNLSGRIRIGFPDSVLEARTTPRPCNGPSSFSVSHSWSFSGWSSSSPGATWLGRFIGCATWPRK